MWERAIAICEAEIQWCLKNFSDEAHYKLSCAEDLQDAISAEPLPTRAEQLAHARQLPEIKAMVETSALINQKLRDLTFSRHSTVNPPMTAFIDLTLPEQAIADYEAALAALEVKNP
jgi:hypothetical protein